MNLEMKKNSKLKQNNTKLLYYKNPIDIYRVFCFKEDLNF